MKRKVKIGMLTGLLLAPAMLAQVDNATANTIPTNTLTLVALTDAELALKADLSAPLNALSESSTRTEITTAKNLFLGMNSTEKALFTADELAFMQAKLNYVEPFPDFVLRAQKLKADIDKLSLTSATLFTDIPVVEASYTKLFQDITKAEQTFKAAIPTGTSTLDPLLKNVKMYNYTDTFNDDYLQQQTGNLNVLKSRTALLQHVNATIDSIKTVESAMNTTTFSPTDFRAALIAAQSSYAQLSVDEKSVIDTYTPAGKELSYGKVLTNATNFLKAAQTVDKNLLSIVETMSATDFITKMKTISTAYNALTATQKQLLEQETLRAQYQGVMDINNAITALKISSLDSYRTAVKDIITRYDNLSPTTLQNFVAKYGDIVLTAKTDIDAAEGVEKSISQLTSPTTTLEQVMGARAQYNALSTNAQKVVNNLATLTTYESSAASSIKVIKLISALDPSASTFVTATLAADKAYTSLATDREKLLVYNSDILNQLLPTANVLKKINALKISNATYISDVYAINTLITNATNVLWKLDGTKQDNIVLSATQLNTLRVMYYGQKATTDTAEVIGVISKMSELTTRIQKALQIDQTIVELAAITTADSLVPAIAEVRNNYNALMKIDPASKSLVKKYADFVTIEKKYQAALKVIQLINGLNPEAENFVKTVLSTKVAYSKLDSVLKPYVYNYDLLDIVSNIASTVQLIDTLKPSQKTYRTDVAKARADYNQILADYNANKWTVASLTTFMPVAAFTTDEKKVIDTSILLLKGREPLLLGAEAKIAKADQFDARIVALTKESNLTFISKLSALLTEYQAMTADDKKLIQYAKTMTEQEKLNKNVLKVINLIDVIDKASKNYTKTVIAARKAYDSLETKAEKDRVYNYSALTKVEGVATVIYRIDGLKTSNKTFIDDVKDIRALYDKLNTLDKRSVVNYDQLVFMEGELAIAEVVMNLIREAVPTSDKYLEKLSAARNAYDSLDASRKKIVANIQDLKERESSVKKILDVMKQIDQLNPDTTDFAKKVIKAREDYLKLDIPQRALVSNLSILEGYEPTAKVVMMISQLKPGSSTFHEDVKAARTAYTALPADKQSQVNNYNVLVTDEKNIIGAKAVDDLIYALKNNDPKEYIQKVEEARAAFNDLTADQKKAVKYASVLKDEEAFVKPAKVVIELIAGMYASTDMAKQYPKVQAAYAKLNDEQRTFIYNDYLLKDLDNVIRVYNRIAALKDTDPSYISLVASIRRDYELLSASEKSKVLNYSKLQEAELSIEAVKKVDGLIYALSPKSPTYFDDIQQAMDQYNALPAGLKKQLLYGSALLQADANKKAAQKVIQMIQAIDENLRTFETQVLAAQDAFKQLTVDQQKLVANYRLLEEYLTYLQ